MSVKARYRKLTPHLQTDLLGAAANTGLRQLLNEEIAMLQQELGDLSVPDALTTANAITFCMEYRKRREMKLWMEELLATLDLCRDDFYERQAQQE
jgi:hypothetical protein